MSEQEIMRFLTKIESDPALSERFEAMTSADDAIGLAASLGYSVTSEDLRSVAEQIAAGSEPDELDDEQLEGVAGGGRRMQGRFVNGRLINGRMMNGRWLNGQVWNSRTQSGAGKPVMSLTGVRPAGSDDD
jgi:predicted ribosomally synthesized peptide with nif11-like leader